MSRKRCRKSGCFVYSFNKIKTHDWKKYKKDCLLPCLFNFVGRVRRYIGFNRIERFRPQDTEIQGLQVLDLAGNPLESLQHCPPCKELIVSSTRIRNLEGCPEGVEIIRCGHSTFLESLRGWPSTIKLIECSCAPNLRIEEKDIPKSVVELLIDRSIPYHSRL